MNRKTIIAGTLLALVSLAALAALTPPVDRHDHSSTVEGGDALAPASMALPDGTTFLGDLLANQVGGGGGGPTGPCQGDFVRMLPGLCVATGIAPTLIGSVHGSCASTDPIPGVTGNIKGVVMLVTVGARMTSQGEGATGVSFFLHDDSGCTSMVSTVGNTGSNPSDTSVLLTTSGGTVVLPSDSTGVVRWQGFTQGTAVGDAEILGLVVAYFDE